LFFKHFIHLTPKSRLKANFPAYSPRQRATVKTYPPPTAPHSPEASFKALNNNLIFNDLHQSTIFSIFPSTFPAEIFETTFADAFISM
jgi:hypothetical protein